MYYLYAVSSRWDKEKKRSAKITGKLLGKIIEQDGFVESDKARIARQQMKIAHLQVKEYGVTALIGSVFHDIVLALQQHFPDIWKEIVCLSYGRLMHRSSLKNMQHHYACSYLSEQYSGLDLSPKRLSSFLRSLGQERSRIVAFCRSFRLEDDCILFDGTDIFSHSEQLDLPKFGKTKFGTCDEIINMMCMYSVGQQMPVYYRLLPGNIKDTVSFHLCLKESGAKNAIVIIDKGFASKKNIESLESVPLRYIIPLPRNSAMIAYERSKSGNKNLFDGYFMYHKRYIWYYAQPIDKQQRVLLFLDEDLRNREEKDYLNRIESKATDYTIDKFYAKQHVFGTIAIIDNTAMQPEEIYVRYKTRG